MPDSRTSRSDIAAAARALGVNPNTVRTWLAQGGLASLDPVDVEAMRAWLYDDEEPAPPPPVQRSRARSAIPEWQRAPEDCWGWEFQNGYDVARWLGGPDV